MARQTEFIQLSKEERHSLKTLFSGGNGSNRKYNRARILDLLSKHTPPPEIVRDFGCFYVNSDKANGGGTGHTIRICQLLEVPVIEQNEWLKWLYSDWRN